MTLWRINCLDSHSFIIEAKDEAEARVRFGAWQATQTTQRVVIGVSRIMGEFIHRGAESQ